jgi:hypothetical protein
MQQRPARLLELLTPIPPITLSLFLILFFSSSACYTMFDLSHDLLLFIIKPGAKTPGNL